MGASLQTTLLIPMIIGIICLLFLQTINDAKRTDDLARFSISTAEKNRDCQDIYTTQSMPVGGHDQTVVLTSPERAHQLATAVEDTFWMLVVTP